MELQTLVQSLRAQLLLRRRQTIALDELQQLSPVKDYADFAAAVRTLQSQHILLPVAAAGADRVLSAFCHGRG